MQVMGWAANMPVFAQQLASIAEGVISRLLDVLYNASVGSTSTSSVMSGRADIATKMALEPAGALLQVWHNAM